MDRIERYRAFGADGRALDEKTTLTEINQRRWRPSTIVRLEWECGGKPVEIWHVYGLMAQLLPDSTGVALLRASIRNRFSPALELIEPDGSTRFMLTTPLRVDGRDVTGEFAWFESPDPRKPRVIRTVFWSSTDDHYYLLDIDAGSGVIIGVLPLQ